MEQVSYQQEMIGPYRLLHCLGKGGMGEVFLAYDPICKRNVALKRVRPDLTHHPFIRERFLREAHIASQLTHPSIIPIYAISQEEETYYTMPYVEGQTLGQILRETKEEQKQGAISHPIGASIPSLMRIFLNVCQAIAYCHAKKVLHRDLKPENIIVGKYGEVLILDWGIAVSLETPMKDPIETPLEENALSTTEGKNSFPDLTQVGKIPGTITYIPPERAFGEPSSPLGDIYSLGVILYQMLTLKMPFHRTSLAHFRKNFPKEKIPLPVEAAPYRDISLQLSHIALKCLAPHKEKRYQSVEELIGDLENYIKGRPEWIAVASLCIDKKTDWEFQENIILAKDIAITRNLDMSEWVSMMISKASFLGNTKLETEVCLGPQCKGIGFLLSIPEADQRKGLEEGYCLWIESSDPPHCKLYRSNVEVLHVPHEALRPYPLQKEWRRITIEKTDHSLRLLLDGNSIFNYISHAPLVGTHIGLLYRDTDFTIGQLHLFVSSQNAMINCLSVPDAFLASKDYSKALAEYRRISSCFPGRLEGREALFRAGITLLEQAQTQTKKKLQEHFFKLALEEFGKLRSTSGAPLEYLGKSLVYKASGEIEEEAKCLELAVRKYAKHPLLFIVKDHIIFRLHETALHSRLAAYHFSLLSLRHLAPFFVSSDNQRLIDNLKKYTEKLPFIEPLQDSAEYPLQNTQIALQIAFWLSKHTALEEILLSSKEPLIIGNAAFCLLQLRYPQIAQQALYHLEKDSLRKEQLQLALEYYLESSAEAPKERRKTLLHRFLITLPASPQDLEIRTLLYLLEKGLENKDLSSGDFQKLPLLEKEEQLLVDALHSKALLLENKPQEAVKIFMKYPETSLTKEDNPLYFVYGCFLALVEGEKKALAHFAQKEETPYPPLSALLGAYLNGKIALKGPWKDQAFYWEKIHLLRQLSLYYHCAKEDPKSTLRLRSVQRHLHREIHRSL